MAKAIMIQGTASDVGKSLICTALCRIFANDGYRVAPFKSQNMALNSYITKDGGEIGRAQGVQAEAARVDATTDMNPVLLKPKGEMMSEVIVHGRHRINIDAKRYREEFVEIVMPEVEDSLQNLQQQYDIILLEGAGSPAEINLKDRDIANMRMAHLADASVILVADIDRGGVFASIVGTLMLLDDVERARVKGIIINKFRGMEELLTSGIEWLERKTNIPVLGIIPYLDVAIDAEDSLALSSLQLKKPKQSENSIDVAMLRLPHISNFTDIDPLYDEPAVGVRLVSNLHEMQTPDLLILPGTKNTVEDLEWLKQSGMAEAIQRLAKKGTRIFGICGGYQMLGELLIDPDAVEGDGGTFEGLGLIPIETTFVHQKQTIQVKGTLEDGQQVSGYEIHLGRSKKTANIRSFIRLEDDRDDGVITDNGQIIGTYLHGIFHNRLFTRKLFNELRQEKGLPLHPEEVKSDGELREEAYELLDYHVRKHLDMDKLYSFIL